MNYDSQAFADLCHCVMDGRASDEQIQQLERLVLSSRECRREYTAIATLHGDLAAKAEFSSFVIDPGVVATTPPLQPKRSRFKPAVVAAAAVVLLAFGLHAFYAFRSISENRAASRFAKQSANLLRDANQRKMARSQAEQAVIDVSFRLEADRQANLRWAGKSNVAILQPDASLSVGEVIPTLDVFDGEDVSYLGEKCINGTIVLDANNGFFSKESFVAMGRHAAPDGESHLIPCHFTHLVSMSTRPNAPARWYVWVEEPGDVTVNVFMRVPKGGAGAKWKVTLGDAERVVTSHVSSEADAQDWDLQFSVTKPGKQLVTLSKVAAETVSKTQVHAIHLTGASIKQASLLRTRWRPLEFETRLKSSQCDRPTMFVFETRTLTNASCMSKLVTANGLFGIRFDNHQQPDGFYFKMVVESPDTSAKPPLQEMPQILAVGHRDACVGGIGKASIGKGAVGLRVYGGPPLNDRSKSVVQAIRRDVVDGAEFYTAYFYDSSVKRWRLYAQGRRAPAAHRGAADEDAIGPFEISASSFFLGDPASHREGDRLFAVKRRGWAMSSDKTWHPVDQHSRRVTSGESLSNAYVSILDGWFVMAAGGMERLNHRISIPETSDTFQGKELPVFLQPNAVAQLFEYPVEFDRFWENEFTTTEATINYRLAKAGSNAMAVLHYGTRDCLTFAARDDLKPWEIGGLSEGLFSDDRVWEHKTEPVEALAGVNRIRLQGLLPSTAYRYRLMITNDQGKMWAPRSGGFTTD